MKNYILFTLLLLFSTVGIAQEKTINFQFTDIDNKTFKLSDYRGKWVIVNFYATWCPLCWIEVPTLNSLNKRSNIVVIGVALDYGGDGGAVLRAIKQYNLNFERHVLGGSRRDVNSAYRQVGPVDFFPTSYVYNPKGEITMFIPGQFRESTFLNFISNYK